MRSSRAIIGILSIICICGCKEINEKFDKINERLDNLENTTIASINQQIASINASIGDLEQTDSELREYIARLQETATQLEGSIGETNENIARVENELREEIASTEEGLSSDILSAKTELLNNLTALRTEMQGKLDLINTSIGNLQAADINLGLRIDQLRTYTDTSIGNAKDWASATFSTLEQYNLTVTEIAGIKANITSINTAISELETRINDKIATDIAQAVSSLEGKLQQQATDITNAYSAAIATAKGEIEAAYTQAIQTAISNSESSMQSWVNDKLTGYYTIAQTDAKLATLKETLESELNSQKEYLEGKITNLESSLTVKIEANGTLIEGLQTQIDGLSSDLASLAETVAANSRNIAQNAADIATNARNIAANASDIGQCEQLIAANSRLIEANTTAIGENSAAITALQNRLGTDEQSISTNATNIAKNAADIAANAEAIATNAAAITSNASAISTNATNIAALQTSLATAITDITTAYNNAISAAITENNGVINAKIAADIATAQAALQQQIDAILTRLNNIENRLDTLEASVTDLIAMVQSIVVVPDYNDGAVKITDGTENVIRFEVYPLAAAQKLADIGTSAFSLAFIETETRASSLINIPIRRVSFDGEFLSIIADGSYLPDEIKDGTKAANARLRISDGTVTRSSEYFQLCYTSGDIVVSPDEGSFTFTQINGFLDSDNAPKCAMIIVGGWDGEVVRSTVMDKWWHWGSGYMPTDEDDNTLSFLLEKKDTRTGATFGTVVNIPGPDGKYANYVYNNTTDVNDRYRIFPAGKGRWANLGDGVITIYAYEDSEYTTPLYTVASIGAGTYYYDGKSIDVPNHAFVRSFEGPFNTIDWNYPDTRWYTDNLRHVFWLVKKDSDSALPNHAELLAEAQGGNQTSLDTISIVDKNATAETKALLANLWTIADRGWMFGHHDDLWYGRYWYNESGRSDTKEVCGDYPAVFSVDISEIMDDRTGTAANAIRRRVMLEARERGEVILACAHLNNPKTGNDAWDNSSDEVVKEILTEGSTTRTKYLTWLDRCAEFANGLKDSNGKKVPIIFRMYHEHTQTWSWWGSSCTTDSEFINLWKFTISYLRDTKGVHSFLYAISPQMDDVYTDPKGRIQTRWPGDDWVDFIGMDCYHGTNTSAFSSNLKALEEVSAAKKKPCGVTENGLESFTQSDYWSRYIVAPTEGRRISMVTMWRNKYVAGNENDKHYYSIYPGHPSEEDFRKMYALDRTFFSGDLPDMYTMPQGYAIK